MGIWHGKMICIEVKSAKGRVTAEQKDFLQTMANLGAICMIARDLQDVVSAFESLVGKGHSGQSDFC